MRRTHKQGTAPMLPYAAAISRIRKRIKKGDVRLVARVNTPWTLLGLEAWLDRNWTGGEGFVLLMPNGINETKQWLPGEVAFIERFPGIECLAIEPFTRTTYRLQNARRAWSIARGARSMLRAVDAQLPPLAIVSPRDRDLTALVDLGPCEVLQHRKAIFHLLDEGFGDLPVRLNSWRAVEINSRTTRGGAATAIVEAELAVRGRIGRLLAERFDEETHYLVSWDEANARVRVNEEIASAYRTVLARHPVSAPFSRHSRPLAILLTGCLSEFDVMPVEREIAMWTRVAATLRNAGYDVVLKPHPREAPDKFVRMFDGTPWLQHFNGRMAAEKVYQQLQSGDVLVGLSSNSMLTGHLLYRCPVYTLDDLAREYGAAQWLLGTLERYHPAFVYGLNFFRDLERKAADLSSQATHATR